MEDKVSKIFLERLLKLVETEEKLPWEKPFVGFYPFNYFTLYEYTGINRWLIPPGEYITKNQINAYNKAHGTNFRFQKGIQWFPVYFSKEEAVEVSASQVPDFLKDKIVPNGFIGYDSYYYYRAERGTILKCKRIKRYYEVADRTHFADQDGNILPSKIATGEVVMKYSKPDSVISNYIEGSGIKIQRENGEGYYLRQYDILNIPLEDYFISTYRYYSTWFHELAHSTGHASRLNRVGVSWDLDQRNAEKLEAQETGNKKYVYSKEECIAEMACALLCNETQVPFSSNYEGYDTSHISYVQGWSKYFRENAEDLIKVMSEAEKAYKYVMKGTIIQDDGFSEIEKDSV